MTAVIYARYSSDNQREESIEGQIRECTAYAEKNGITVIKHYIDRALSAKTDNRPEFQQMIKDSEKRLFDIVLVWKLDRFARNRYDSAHYEYQLERNHVKLVSATEPISEGPAGIMVKSMLTGMAEYYSAELSEKVVRGMTENVLKGKYNGGTIPIGYTVDEEKFFQIDPLKAPFVVEAFQRYNDGATMKELMNWLNDSGVTTNRNQKFTYNSIQTLLTNRRYIGENRFKDIVMPDSIPVIIEKELFDSVQDKIAKNRRAPARHKAEDDYLLTTKLFCGMCGAMMFGECGTSRNKNVHHYYKCANAKRTKTCKKKTVRKEWLEDLVVCETMKMIHDDDCIQSIVDAVMILQEQENTVLPLLEKQMKDIENGIENLLNAIQAGVLTSSTKGRLEKLEAQQKELEIRIAEEKLAKPKVSADFVKFWLTNFRKLDPNVKSHRETLINTFVNAVYLYDEKVLITFNYKDGTKTITFDEIAAKDASEGNGSDLGCFAPPRERLCRNTRAFFFCTNSKLTQAGGFEQGGGAKHRKQQPSGLLFSPRVWSLGTSTVTAVPAGTKSAERGAAGCIKSSLYQKTNQPPDAPLWKRNCPGAVMGCTLFSPGLFLPDTVAECSQLFAQGQILAVAVDDQFGFVEAELSALVQQALVHITGDDLRQKQIMAAQRDDLRHLALKIQRAFL